jgi:DNA-damage-inducible protein D
MVYPSNFRYAQKVSKSNGRNVSDHFAKVGKVIPTGKGAHLTIDDYRLSRYACYLIAMAGDGNKPEVNSVFTNASSGA